MTQVTAGPEQPPAPPAPPEKPAWRRSPVGPVLLLWAIFTVLFALFGFFVPGRIMGFAASPTMRELEATVNAFTVAAAPVVGLVWAVMLYSLIAWRRKGKERPPDDAPPIREHPRTQVTWLVASSVLCLFLLIWGLVVTAPHGPDVLLPDQPTLGQVTPSLRVGVTGNQWTWNFTYPDNGGIQTEELVLPVNRPVVFEVSSKDVIHSFWIVQMGIKVDANPGETTTASVTPDRTGTYTVRCAELCGLYHSYMQTPVHVVSRDDFAAWLRTRGGTA
jgi:cytochrome c oxidase subunit 2